MTSRCPICGANNRKREQQLIDIIFRIAIQAQMGQIKADSREMIALSVADQLRAIGFDTHPVGMSWGVLR